MSASSQAVALPDASKSFLSLVLSLSPLYFLISARNSLGLDKLHVGLLQVLLLVVLRAGLDMIPSKVKQATTRRRSASPPPAIMVERKASPSPPVAQVAPVEASKKRKTKHDAAKARTKTPRLRPVPPPPPPPKPLPPFSVEKLDETVANFLSITDPAFLSYLPSSAKPTTSIPPAPLSSWTSTYSAADIQVLQHPTLKSLFGICATYPEVPLRSLYEVLQNVGVRGTWDSMTASGEELERFEVEGGRRANVMWMKMKGMAMVKAKDLVLLSIPGTFPTLSTASSIPDAEAPVSDSTKPVASHLKLFAATTSVSHLRAPITNEFNRMQLDVSGFVIEEVNGGKGSRIVQITDLSGLGSWIPSAIMRTITTTMLPKSLIKLGAAAAEAAAGGYDETVEYPPPVLGSWAAPPPPPPVPPFSPAHTLVDEEGSAAGGSVRGSDLASLVDTDEEGDLSSDEEEDDDDVTPASSSSPSTVATTASTRTGSATTSGSDLHALLTQLRALTTRLSTLEALVSPTSSRFLPFPPASSSSTAKTGDKRPWWSLYSSSSTTSSSSSSTTRDGPAAGTETAILSEGKLSAFFTLGSAAGAALAVAAVAAWGRSGRR
ncbi:hypothetical protein JCM11641_005793 [Rhodosporidiobolus odoratus]